MARPILVIKTPIEIEEKKLDSIRNYMKEYYVLNVIYDDLQDMVLEIYNN